MKIFVMIGIFVITVYNSNSKELLDTTRLPYNFNFGLTVGPAFNGADFNATIYDINEPYGTCWLKSFGGYAGVDYYFDRINQYFIKDFYIYSKLGFESVSGTNEKTISTGYNFFSGELQQTNLINTLNTNLLFSNLSIGAKATTYVENLSVLFGINLGFLLSKELELKSELQEKSLEIINPANAVNYADNLSSMQIGLNLGATYKFFTSNDDSYSLDAIFNTKFGLNNLLDLSQNGTERSFGSNSISFGIQLNLHNKKKKDTSIDDTTIIPQKFTIDYIVRNSNSDTTNLYVDINTVDASYIIHPIIYYEDENEVELPNNLIKLTSAAQRAFIQNRANNLDEIDTYNKFYYNYINEIAYQVFAKPNEKIKITYPKNNINDIGLMRAQAIKKYLSDIWNIEDRRIQIVRANIPNNAISLVAQDDNNIVEFTGRKEYTIKSDDINFRLNYPENMLVSRLDLKLQHFKNNGLKTVFEYENDFKEENINVKTEYNSNLVLSNTNYLEFVFKVKEKNGRIIDTMGKIDIVFNDSPNIIKKITGKISDLKNLTQDMKGKLNGISNVQISTYLESSAKEVAKLLSIKNFKFRQMEQTNQTFLSDIFIIKYEQ